MGRLGFPKRCLLLPLTGGLIFRNKEIHAAQMKGQLQLTSDNTMCQVKTWKLSGFAHKELVVWASQNRCVTAADVSRNKNITTFFTLWLERGECIPLTTNVIESRFSQVKNRIKNVGRRWSENGLLYWLMLTLNKIFCPEMWQELWAQYLNSNLSFRLVRLGAEYQWI